MGEGPVSPGERSAADASTDEELLVAVIGRRDLPHPYDDVTERAEVSHDHEQVRAALHHLTERQRQVIDLAYFKGHTYREVAEILDTPLGTIKTRMRDGLIRLRSELEVSR